MSEPSASRQSPTQLLDDVFARVATVDAVADPPGNKWNFALGALFALSATGQLDEDSIGDPDPPRLRMMNRAADDAVASTKAGVERCAGPV